MQDSKIITIVQPDIDTFPEEIRKNNFYLEKMPELNSGEDSVRGRCGTADKPKGTHCQYTFYRWGDTEYAWFGYDYRTQSAILITTAQPDNRSQAKKKRFDRLSASCRNQVLEIDEASRQRIREKYHNCQLFQTGEENPYLSSKGVSACSGIRHLGDSLAIPFRDDNERIVGLQFIGADGSKRMMKGSRVSGVHHLIRGLSDIKLAPYVFVVEGYATGRAISESTNNHVIVAGTCGNLEHAASYAQRRYPKHQVILCADNDHKTEDEYDYNPGLDAARAASSKCGCLVVYPPADEGVNIDFNDYYREHGAEGVRALLAEGLLRKGCRLAPGFELDKYGLWLLGEKSRIYVGKPIEVLASARLDSEGRYGKVLQWTTRDGEIVRGHVMNDALCSKSIDNWLTPITSSYQMDPDQVSLLRKYIALTEPEQKVKVIQQHGLFDNVYALTPTQVVGDQANEYLPSYRSKVSDFTQKGTLEEWKRFACYARGNTILTAALCCAFVGPLLRLANQDSGGIHLIGPSSCGKSTALLFALSVWSSPLGMYTWRLTDNGLERVDTSWIDSRSHKFCPKHHAPNLNCSQE